MGNTRRKTGEKQMKKNRQVGTWMVVFIGIAISVIIVMNYIATIATPLLEIF